MNGKILWPLAVVVLGGAGAYMLANGKPAPVPQPVPARPPPQVDVLQATPQERVVWVGSYGTVRPRQQIDLVAEVSGRVISVADNFEVGATFTAAQPLLQIDPRDYEVALLRARAQLADAQQLLATELGKARQAEREWHDRGSADANALYLREPQVNALRAQLEAGRADVKKAQFDLGRTQVSVPFDGKIRDVAANLGQYLNAGSKIATVFSSDRAEVVLPLTERDQMRVNLEQLVAGQPIPVKLSAQVAGGQQVWRAVVRRTEAAVDEKTRVLHVIAELANATDGESALPALRNGQFVHAEIQGKAYPRTLELPLASLRGGTRIWVVGAGDKLEVVPVEVLREQDGRVLVRVENAAPVRVIQSYLAQPEPGMLVQVHPVDGAQEATP